MAGFLATLLIFICTNAYANNPLDYPPFKWPDEPFIPETSWTLHPDYKSPEEKAKEKQKNEMQHKKINK